jgi:glucosyl-3-phosphoglycerate synthase
VDEILVVDSHSTDGTARVAIAAGARVVVQDMLPGKGAALWQGVSACTGDAVVFVDGDVSGFPSTYVTGLLGPLLLYNEVVYVKGFYDRSLRTNADADTNADGGRVTELVARPMLNLFWPDLAGFVQPLSGEAAGRRDVLQQLHFVTNYGVETGFLIDMFETYGLNALAQVDLGQRIHRHQSMLALGQMSGQIMLTVLDRLGRDGRLALTRQPEMQLMQFQKALPRNRLNGLQRDIVLTDLKTSQLLPLASQKTSAVNNSNTLEDSLAPLY